MKVCHLCTFRSGGAGIAARRIHKAVAGSGAESRIIYRDDRPGLIPTWRRCTVCPVSRCLRKIMDLRIDAFDHPGCYGHSESLFPFASADLNGDEMLDLLDLRALRLLIGQ